MSALGRTLSGWVVMLVGLTLFGMVEARAGSVFLESGGQVVGEAEHFTARTDSPIREWRIVPNEDPGIGTFKNARGGQYIQALPDLAPINSLPTVDYRVRITTPGEYQLYLRWDGRDINSDSLFAGIVEQIYDSTPGSVADWYELSHDPTPGSDADFATAAWDGFGGKGTNTYNALPKVAMTWSLGVGEWTLRLRMREDGSAVDTWILQLKDMAAPTGVGPAESAIVPLPSALPAGIALLGLGALARWCRRHGRHHHAP